MMSGDFCLPAHPELFSSMSTGPPVYNMVYTNTLSPIPPRKEFISRAGYWQEELSFPRTDFSQHTIYPSHQIITSAEPSEAYLPLHNDRENQALKSKQVPLAVLSRRRAQNRASQQAYRKRKENLIQNLETRLSEMSRKYEKLVAEHERVKTEYEKVGRVTEISRYADDSKNTQTERRG